MECVVAGPAPWEYEDGANRKEKGMNSMRATSRNAVRSLACLGFGVGLGLNLCAQDPVEKAAPETGAPVAAPVAAVGESATAIKSDSGVAAVYQAQAIIVQPDNGQETVTAKLRKALRAAGLDVSSKRDKNGSPLFISTATVGFESDNPATDQNFIVKREAKAKEAILNAKKKAVEFICVECDAFEQSKLPGSNADVFFSKKIDSIKQKLNDQKKKAEQLMADAGDAQKKGESDGPSVRDVKVFIDAVIKKLDPSYNPGKYSETQIKKVKVLKEEYEATISENAKIEKELADMNQSLVSSFKSKITKSVPEMPIFGTTVLFQAESYLPSPNNPNTKTYEIGVALVWSLGLEEAAKSILMGIDAKVSPPPGNKPSLVEWLDKQDLSSMVGPRQFMDAKGNRYFLGISAFPAGKTSADKSKAERFSADFAQQAVLFSLLANVSLSSDRSLSAATTDNGDKTEVDTLTTETEELTQAFKKKKISGLRPLGPYDNVRHPISGQMMVVSVYSIDPEDAKFALARERASYITALEVNRKQAEMMGQSAGMRTAVKASENDPAAFQKGTTQGMAIEREAAAREAAAKAQAAAVDTQRQHPQTQPNVTPPTTIKPNRSATEGTFLGDKDVNTDL